MKIFLQIFPALLFLFSFHSLHGQITPSIEWQKSLGGSIGETSNSIQQTFDGGFIVGGYSKSNDGDVSGNNGNTDYWVVKLDAEGNIVWEKSLGGSDHEAEWYIRQTSDSGFVVVGQAKSNDGDVSGNHGNTDFWIVKLDKNGNLTWQKSLGGSDYDEAYSVSQTSDGGFIVAGNSESNDGDVSGNHGDYDFWVVKLDVDGNLTWQKSLGGSSEDESYSVQQTADGGYIVAGGSESNDGDVSGNHGDQDIWIVKLDMDGNVTWQKCLGGSSDEEAICIQQTTDGGFIVAGPSASNDGDVSGNNGNADYWIVKLDAVGNIMWEKSYGGSDYDNANFVHQTNDGGFVIAGHSYSNDGDVSGNYGLTDYWIIRLDTAGNLMWQKPIGGSSYDQAYSIQQTTDGSFIIAGLSFSNDGDVSGNHGNTQDCWVVKLTSETPSGLTSISNNIVSLYPNPVQTDLVVDLVRLVRRSFSEGGLSETTIHVYDLQGRVIVLPITLTNTLAQINATTLPNGFYTIQITDNKTGNSAIGKFVKQQ